MLPPQLQREGWLGCCCEVKTPPQSKSLSSNQTPLADKLFLYSRASKHKFFNLIYYPHLRIFNPSTVKKISNRYAKELSTSSG